MASFRLNLPVNPCRSDRRNRTSCAQRAVVRWVSPACSYSGSCTSPAPCQVGLLVSFTATPPSSSACMTMAATYGCVISSDHPRTAPACDTRRRHAVAPEPASIPEYHDYSPSRHALGSTATPSEPRLGFNTMAFGTSTTGYPCSSTPRYVTPLAATCPA